MKTHAQILKDIEEASKNESRIDFSGGGAQFRLLDDLLQTYGFHLMPTRASVGDKTVAVIKPDA